MGSLSCMRQTDTDEASARIGRLASLVYLALVRDRPRELLVSLSVISSDGVYALETDCIGGICQAGGPGRAVLVLVAIWRGAHPSEAQMGVACSCDSWSVPVVSDAQWNALQVSLPAYQCPCAWEGDLTVRMRDWV